jgi:ABC-type Fe3+-hydroxamate transport system substrate-binding protein
MRSPMNVRIASLVPSLTELLFALGLGPWVVARTGFCIHPADGVNAVPKVGGTKDVNLAKLRRLAPTHALVNVDENRIETADALREFVSQVIVTHPCGPDEVAALITQIADAFAALPGVGERAAALRAELSLELAATVPGQAVPVLYMIWREPWMTVTRDTYISRLLARAGWQTLPAQHGGERGAARYPTLYGDEPWLAGVRELLLSSEPYAFTREHFAQAQALCPHARVRLVDGELLSWYGPRTAAGLRYLRQVIGDKTA